MKRFKYVIPISAALFLLVFMTGCQKQQAEVISGQETQETAFAETPFTEEDLIALFTEEQERLDKGRPEQDYEILDCVLADDGAYDLAGVLAYTPNETKPEEDIMFYLVFMGTDGLSQRVGIGMMYQNEEQLELSEDSELSYEGQGKVSIPMRGQETGELFKYTMEFGRDEDGKVTFRSGRS